MTVQDIRSFNRFYDDVIGALDYGRHLYAPYTLTETRVLYELAHARRTDAADLRAELSLDAGYLSRILNKFEQDGLIERAPSETDPRRRRVGLTPRGRDTAALLEERARESVSVLLDGVSPDDRPRLAEAMRTIRTVLGATAHRAPRTWCCATPPRATWAGSCSATPPCTPPSTAGTPTTRAGGTDRRRLRRGPRPAPGKGVDRRERGGTAGGMRHVRTGRGPGHRPAAAAARRARRTRPRRRRPPGRGVVVRRAVSATASWSCDNDVLAAARRIYRRHGFVLVGEKPHRSFGKDLSARTGGSICSPAPLRTKGTRRRVGSPGMKAAFSTLVSPACPWRTWSGWHADTAYHGVELRAHPEEPVHPGIGRPSGPRWPRSSRRPESRSWDSRICAVAAPGDDGPVLGEIRAAPGPGPRPGRPKCPRLPRRWWRAVPLGGRQPSPRDGWAPPPSTRPTSACASCWRPTTRTPPARTSCGSSVRSATATRRAVGRDAHLAAASSRRRRSCSSPYLGYVQVKDIASAEDRTRCRSFRCAPAHRVREVLSRHDWDGWLCWEYEKRWYEARGAAAGTARTGRRHLARLLGESA